MIYGEPYRHVAENIRRDIDDMLNSVGFLCRVFGRGKSPNSIERKLSIPGKYVIGKRLIQDAIGVRVVLYFPEDVSIVEEVLRGKFECDDKSTTIDMPTATVFSVSRHNLVFRLPERLRTEISASNSHFPIDSTFEVQIRTILSEGWHEVEHDLRYKRPNDWVGHDDLSRGLNGVVATLETAEWSMRKIFDDLAYRHYKQRQWEAMLHTTLRMRTVPNLSKEISTVIDEDGEVAKELSRIKRKALFRSLFKLAPRIPITLDNLVYVWNYTSIGNARLAGLTPSFLIENFDASLVKK